MFFYRVLIYLLSFTAGPPLPEQPLRVAVAANAQFVAQKIKEAYEKETRQKVALIFSSSGKLTTQIKQGAPFDVFLSADTQYPETLQQAGLLESPPRVYAYGSLILWTNKKLNLTPGMKIVLHPSVKRIAIANPDLAPYGKAALQALAYYKLDKAVQPKLIFAESVAQVNQYVLSGAADLGFTAQAVVLEPAMQNKGKWFAPAAASYPRIGQSAVLLKAARKRKPVQARQFYNFLYGPQAKFIFKKYGYQTS